MLGQAGEDHGDELTGMLVASAGNHDPIAVHFATISRGLKGHGHFGPGRKRRGASKFDSVSVNDY